MAFILHSKIKYTDTWETRKAGAYPGHLMRPLENGQISKYFIRTVRFMQVTLIKQSNILVDHIITLIKRSNVFTEATQIYL